MYVVLVGPNSIKGNIVADNVECFNVSEQNGSVVYITKSDNYNLYLKKADEEKLIISSPNKLSYLSISSDGNNITFTGINVLGENRICQSILDGKEEFCSDIYWYNLSDNNIENITSDFDGNSYISSISGNGRYVAIESSSSNVTGDYIYRCKSYQNNIDRSCSNIYKFDLINKKYSLISKHTLSGSEDSMEPSINYSGDSIIFRSFAPFFNSSKSCYNQYYDEFSYCSTIYLHKDNKLTMISDDKYDSYNGNISSKSNFVSFDSYSTMSLFEYHYQNSTFLYDINKNEVSVINKSPNRVINNVMISSNGKFNISISRATNIADSHSFMDNLIVTNIFTGKSIILDNDTVYDVKNGIITDDIVYILRDKKIVEVKLNTNAPIIKSSKDLTIIQGSNYNLLKYISVEDDLDENVNVYVSDYGDFNGNKPGKYTITIRAVDSNMNSSFYSYDVIVVERDIKSPIFVGDDYYRIKVNDKSFRLSDYVHVYDDVDDKVNYFVESGSVDITKAGKYKLLLKCSDSSSNNSYLSVTIEVVDDSLSFFKALFGVGIFSIFVLYIIFLKKK